MRIIGKVTSVILIIVAIMLFMLAACNTAIDSTMRAPETYSSLLNNDAIFEDLLPVAFPAMVQTSGGDSLERHDDMDESPVEIREVARVLDAETWRETTNLLITPDFLQERTNQIVSSMISIINGNLAVLDDPFDLSDVRQRLTGTEARQAAELIVTGAPECTRTQTDDLATLLATGTGELPICNPADDELRQNSINFLVTWLAVLAQSLQSDTPTLSGALNLDRDTARAMNLIFELDRQGLVLTFLCPLSLLALVVVLTIRSMKGLGRWTGATFILSGIGVFVLLALMQLAAFSIIGELVNTENDVEVFFARVVSEMTRSVIARASGTMLGIGGFYIALGFVLFVLAWFITRGDDNNGELVLVGEDGEIISTATQKRVGRINQSESP